MKLYNSFPKEKKRLKHKKKDESGGGGRTDGFGHARPGFFEIFRCILRDPTDTNRRWFIIFTNSPFRLFASTTRVAIELEECIPR
jgi:hypothetical protein